MKTELIKITDGKAVTTSLQVADIFGKRHYNLLAKIENLECSKEFHKLNFKQIFYLDKYKRNQKSFEITKDGFTILSFTGKKVIPKVEIFINAFKQMNVKHKD